MKRGKLDALLRKWQKRLSLQDWDITLQVVPALSQDAWAHTDIDEFHGKARITLVDPEQQDRSALAWRSAEHLIVHELLHVRLEPSGVKDGSAEHVAQERGINEIAVALLVLEKECQE